MHKTIYITESQYNSLILETENNPNTMLFWHGGDLDNLKQEFNQKSGRYEYGPGLYLITNYSEAIKYSKGRRKLYQVEVAKGTDIAESKIDIESAINFVRKNCITSKIKDIMFSLEKYLSDGMIPAYIFNNLVINFEALKPSNTNKLKLFYINNGIDYEIVNNPFGWADAKMMILYNIEKIVNIKRIIPNDKIDKFDLHESKRSNLDNYLKQAANKMTNDIPSLFKQKVDEWLKTQKMVIFDMDDVKVYIYDSSINKTRTGTPIFPKHIYLNVDYLSDFVDATLMGSNNIYIGLYYAFLHELGHITSKIPPEAMPDDDYVKYINSPSEKHAMEFANVWLRAYTEPVYKKFNMNESIRFDSKMFNNDTINEAEYNYHFGKIDDTNNVKPYGSDSKNMMSGRGTGHFGSGLYFSTYKCNDKRDVDDKHIDNPEFVQIKNGVYRTDFDLYKNLYRVKSEKQGDNLFYSLKEINSLYQIISYYVKYKDQLPSDFSQRYLIVKNNFKYLGLKMPEYKEFIEMCVSQAKNDDDIRSMSTAIMEYNGFNGVNVSGIYAYDNTTHGSVIYDISKVSDDLKKVDVDHSRCELKKTETGNKIAGDIFNIKNKLLSDSNILSIYTDEFNKLPENEQLVAINRYKYLLDGLTLKELNKQTISAYFKSLPRKIRNNSLLGKITARQIEPILDYGYQNIIYDINNKIGEMTFLEYAIEKLGYSNHFDKLVKGINRPLSNEEKEALEWYS